MCFGRILKWFLRRGSVIPFLLPPQGALQCEPVKSLRFILSTVCSPSPQARPLGQVSAILVGASAWAPPPPEHQSPQPGPPRSWGGWGLLRGGVRGVRRPSAPWPLPTLGPLSGLYHSALHADVTL